MAAGIFSIYAPQTEESKSFTVTFLHISVEREESIFIHPPTSARQQLPDMQKKRNKPEKFRIIPEKSR